MRKDFIYVRINYDQLFQHANKVGWKKFAQELLSDKLAFDNEGALLLTTARRVMESFKDVRKEILT